MHTLRAFCEAACHAVHAIFLSRSYATINLMLRRLLSSMPPFIILPLSSSFSLSLFTLLPPLFRCLFRRHAGQYFDVDRSDIDYYFAFRRFFAALRGVATLIIFDVIIDDC